MSAGWYGAYDFVFFNTMYASLPWSCKGCCGMLDHFFTIMLVEAPCRHRLPSWWNMITLFDIHSEGIWCCLFCENLHSFILYNISATLIYYAGHIERRFIEVPHGATWVEATMRTSGFDTARRFFIDAVQVLLTPIILFLFLYACFNIVLYRFVHWCGHWSGKLLQHFPLLPLEVSHLLWKRVWPWNWLLLSSGPAALAVMKLPLLILR